MPGLVPGIHVLRLTLNEDVDGRDKPGHDEGWFCVRVTATCAVRFLHQLC